MAPRFRAIIADDHSLYRAGLRSLFDDHEDIEIISEARDGVELLEQTLSLRPDLVLLDYDMPKMSGLDVLSQLKKSWPTDDLKIVVITASSTEDVLAEFVDQGVNAIVSKKEDTNIIVGAVDAVLRGEYYISDELASQIKRVSQMKQLTSRERQVIRLIAKGLQNKAISRIMGIATKTVDAHRTKLMKKLGLHNAAEVISFALRNKLG